MVFQYRSQIHANNNTHLVIVGEQLVYGHLYPEQLLFIFKII